MEFTYMSFNGTCLGVNGQCSFRDDESIVVELERNIPRSEVEAWKTRCIENVVFRNNQTGQFFKAQGPYYLKEYLGLMILEYEKDNTSHIAHFARMMTS